MKPCSSLSIDSDSDVELFDDNPVEYLRHDIEGSDSDTRRRSATELVKSLRKHFEKEVTDICAGYVTVLLQQYSSNPEANWKAKDVAVYLVTALAVRSSTASQGTTNVNALVPVVDFFFQQVLPEVQSPKCPVPILRADALKFIINFRQQLSKETLLKLFSNLMVCLESPIYVLHSYAASALERILLIKDKLPSGEMISRFQPSDIAPILDALLSSLLKPLQLDISKENEYVMKAIMRLISFSQNETMKHLNIITRTILEILSRICQNPVNPYFNHFLFETIAALVNLISKHNPSSLPAFEGVILDIVAKILQQDIQEFCVYVFQILAFLLEVTTPTPIPNGLGESYLRLLPHLLAPIYWERTSNIPGLVRLLTAFLKRGSKQIITSKQLEPLLGVFQKLVSTRSQDHEGFYLLEAIVEYSDPYDLSPYMKTVFTLIFTRLNSNKKNIKLLRSFLVFLCLYIGKRGPSVVISQIDTIQSNLFLNLLDSLWLPNIQNIIGAIERKMVAIAMTKLLAPDNYAILTEQYMLFWSKILNQTLLIIELPEDETIIQTEPENEWLGIEETDFSSGSYAPLAQAPKPNVDPFSEFPDPKSFLATSLYKLFHECPGKFPSIVESLGPNIVQMLTNYFQMVPNLSPPYLV